MIESEFTSGKLIPELRKVFANDVVIFKHNDAITSGIPDISITKIDFVPRTLWLEVKMIDSPSKMFKPLQVETLKRLGGYYFVWDQKAKWGYLFRPEDRENWSDVCPLGIKAAAEKIRRMF